MCETGFDLIESQFNGVASDCDPIASDKLIDTAAPIDPSHLCRAVSSSEEKMGKEDKIIAKLKDENDRLKVQVEDLKQNLEQCRKEKSMLQAR